jgi:hypothetical protein
MPEQALFLSCGLIAIGLILATAGAVGALRSAQSQRWPSVQGEVTASGLVRQGDQARPYVRYRYRIAEKTYTGGALIHYGEPNPITRWLGASAENAPPIQARYPQGSPVTVYYDPSNPDRSVLEPGVRVSAYLPVAAGGLLFILGLVAGIFAFM